MPLDNNSKTNFERLQSMSLDDLAKWIDEYGQYDGAPWTRWFDETYCNNCPSEIIYYVEDTEHRRPIHCAWCELNNKCKFFQHMDETPSSFTIVKMWLEKTV